MLGLLHPPSKEVLAHECELRGLAGKRSGPNTAKPGEAIELVQFLVQRIRDNHSGDDNIKKMTSFGAGKKFNFDDTYKVSKYLRFVEDAVLELTSRSLVCKIYRQRPLIDHSRPLAKTPAHFGVAPALTKGRGNGEDMKTR
jgi:hypothetical protein